MWHLRSTEAVRQLLRAKDATTQAGFSAELMPPGVGERPILFLDGEEHRKQRTKVARFFAPKTVTNRYRQLMETRADALVREACTATTFRLDQLSLRYSTEVAAQVIGLTNSNVDGMATTREFISMAVLHLLADATLRARYLEAQEPERYGILHEILRLEPIIGHLYRRAARDLDLTVNGEILHIRQGALIDLYVRQANSDATTVGECPLDLRPGRPLPPGIGPEVMSFGDGHHKCPGNSLAIQETDILLTRLLRHDLIVAHPPVIDWDELIAGYSLREFVLTVPKPLPVAPRG